LLKLNEKSRITSQSNQKNNTAYKSAFDEEIEIEIGCSVRTQTLN
jgi:hypothetical protein